MHDQLRQKMFLDARNMLENQNIRILKEENDRPWGGFLVIEPQDSERFLEVYFPNYTVNLQNQHHPISAKFLIVSPNKRLSWQFHNRRNEIWHVILGDVGVVTGTGDEENELHLLGKDQLIHLKVGIRHRLVGLDKWSLVAEIWEHTDPEHPSNEEDIVRVQDDFGR